MNSIPIDPLLETQVAEVLQRKGLTTEAAVRILFVLLAEHGSMSAAEPHAVVASSAAVANDTMMRAV